MIATLLAQELVTRWPHILKKRQEMARLRNRKNAAVVNPPNTTVAVGHTPWIFVLIKKKDVHTSAPNTNVAHIHLIDHI